MIFYYTDGYYRKDVQGRLPEKNKLLVIYGT